MEANITPNTQLDFLCISECPYMWANRSLAATTCNRGILFKANAVNTRRRRNEWEYTLGKHSEHARYAHTHRVCYFSLLLQAKA